MSDRPSLFILLLIAHINDILLACVCVAVLLHAVVISVSSFNVCIV